MKKINVDLLMGGISEEHDVSIVSGVNVCNSLLENRDRLNINIILIDKDGRWLRSEVKDHHREVDAEFIQLLMKEGTLVTPSIDPTYPYYIELDETTKKHPLPDVFFPILHGRGGEDGKIQSLFETLGIKYVGCDSNASLCAMDKTIMKKIFHEASLPILPWIEIKRSEYLIKDKEGVCNTVLQKLPCPMFIKPASQGSSIGVSKVSQKDELEGAIDEAFKYDEKLIIEPWKVVRELECSVLGYQSLTLSTVGEIIPSCEFYDYYDKYSSGKSRIEIPADIEPNEMEYIKRLAEKVYRVLGCSGFARIDFFMEKDNRDIYINEINTIPGFTESSMFPKLMNYEGISNKDLVMKLVQLALEK